MDLVILQSKLDVMYVGTSDSSDDPDTSLRMHESFSEDPQDKPANCPLSSFESQSPEMGRRSGQDVPSELITLTLTTMHELIEWINAGEKLLQLQRAHLKSGHPSLDQLTMARLARHFCKT